MKGLIQKRGLAEIITVILIILLSLAAIGIIWTVIRPVILKTTSQISLSCTTSMDLKIDSANCSDSRYWTVRVSRGVGEGNIKSIKFVFSSDDESKNIEWTKLTQDYNKDTPGMPNELDIKIYKFDIENLSIPSTANKVKIAPVIVGEGGADIPCQVLDTKDCTK